MLSFPCVFISHTGIQSLWFQTLFYVIELIHLPPFTLRWELERQTLWVHVCLLMEWTLQVETVLMRTTGVELCPFLTWLLKQMFSCFIKTTHPLILFLLRDQSSFLSMLCELLKEQLKKKNWRSVESLCHYRQIWKKKKKKRLFSNTLQSFIGVLFELNASASCYLLTLLVELMLLCLAGWDSQTNRVMFW